MKQFGGKLTKDQLSSYEQSPNWRDGSFQNLVKTEMNFSIRDVPGMLHKQFIDRKGRVPKKPIPVATFDLSSFISGDQTKIIWYGHSVILLRICNKTILIDPMMGPDASPIAPFKTRRFSEGTLDILDQLPPIDLLLMTHDHYDHLDLASIRRLQGKVKQYIVGLGIKRHLTRWGVDASHVEELDWWQDKQIDNIQITYTPTRHFSGRGVSDRQKSLWGGWAITTPHEKIYFSGDGGYGEHFKEVGKRLGPFDFGIMECGQYNELWHQIHMYPEESIQAAKDAGVQTAMAVHWAGFPLAMHHWKDPIERFVAAAEKKSQKIVIPEIGQTFHYLDDLTTPWWVNLE